MKRISRLLQVKNSLPALLTNSTAFTKKNYSHLRPSRALLLGDKDLYGFDWEEIEISANDWSDTSYDTSISSISTANDLDWKNFQRDYEEEAETVVIVDDKEEEVVVYENVFYGQDVGAYHGNHDLEFYRGDSYNDNYNGNYDYSFNWTHEKPKRKIFWKIFKIWMVIMILSSFKSKKRRKIAKKKNKKGVICNYFYSWRKVLPDPIEGEKTKPVLLIDVMNVLAKHKRISPSKISFTTRRHTKQFIETMSKKYDVILYMNYRNNDEETRSVLDAIFKKYPQNKSVYYGLPRLHFPHGLNDLEEVLKNRKIEKIVIFGGDNNMLNKFKDNFVVGKSNWEENDTLLKDITPFFLCVAAVEEKDDSDVREIIKKYNFNGKEYTTI